MTYVNKLAFIIESYGIKIKLFADDVKLYIQIVADVDVAQMQQASLVNWATEWQLQGRTGVKKLPGIRSLRGPFPSPPIPFPFLLYGISLLIGMAGIRSRANR